MYSIIDSCDETSGWHLSGLCNVKETDLSFVVQTVLCVCRENLATVNSAGLNMLRCHKAWLHTVDCATEHCQERELFFFSIMSVEHYLSLTSCLSRKRFRRAWSAKREAWRICGRKTLQHSVQQLVSASGWRRRDNLSEHSQVLNTVWERCMLCVSDFCCYKYLPPRKRCLMWTYQTGVSHFICWGVKLPPLSACLFWGQHMLTSNVGVLCCEKKLLSTWTFSNMRTLQRGLWSGFNPLKPLSQHLPIYAIKVEQVYDGFTRAFLFSSSVLRACTATVYQGWSRY